VEAPLLLETQAALVGVPATGVPAALEAPASALRAALRGRRVEPQGEDP